MHQAKSRCFASRDSAESAANPSAAQPQPIDLERLSMSFEQAVGRGIGEVVQRAAERRLGCRQIEGMRPVAEVEDVDAQRIERQIERHPEIRREMRSCDLQPVRLQIVDEDLAEAAFLADSLLGRSAPHRRFSSSDATDPTGRSRSAVVSDRCWKNRCAAFGSNGR